MSCLRALRIASYRVLGLRLLCSGPAPQMMQLPELATATLGALHPPLELQCSDARRVVNAKALLVGDRRAELC